MFYCKFYYILDINECLDDNAGCQQVCNNIIGSYLCSCNDGFMLDENRHNCSGMLYIIHMQVHVSTCVLSFEIE